MIGDTNYKNHRCDRFMYWSQLKHVNREQERVFSGDRDYSTNIVRNSSAVKLCSESSFKLLD